MKRSPRLIRQAAIAITERIGEMIERESLGTKLSRHALSLERLGRWSEAHRFTSPSTTRYHKKASTSPTLNCSG